MDDLGGGTLDSTDLFQFIFSSPMASAVDDAGSSFRLLDDDGTVHEVVCGSSAVCFLLPGGTYNGETAQSGQVMRVRILGSTTLVSGPPLLSYPAQLSSVSSWRSATTQLLDLAASPDTTANVGPLVPARNGGVPSVQSAVETGTDEVTVGYDRSLVLACGGSPNQAQQFAFTSAFGFFNGVSASTVGTTVVVGFPSTSPIEDNSVSEGTLDYGDATPTGPDCGDVIDFSGNPAPNIQERPTTD